VVVGHHTSGGGLVYDATVVAGISTGTDYRLGVSLKGTTVALTLDGGQVLGYVFNSLVVDGAFGVLSTGASSFDEVTVQTDDPAFRNGNPDNNLPTAVDDSGTVDEDTVLGLDVLANDSDADAEDTLTITAVTQGSAGGVVSIDGNLISYDPTGVLDRLAAGETLTDSFGYTISDSNGGFATATVSITVTGLNDAPLALADSAQTNEDATVTIDVLLNDSDPDSGAILGITAVTQGANGGLVSFTADGLVYNPNGQFDALVLGESATDTFTYTVTDNNGSSVTAAVTVVVNGIAAGNLAPEAGNDTLATSEDTALLITRTGLLANDSDQDGDALSIGTVSQPAHGVLNDNGNGTWTYAPAANYYGTDSFTYVLSDGRGGTATATVNISVAAVNDAPLANADSFVTVEDMELTISVATLLANDTDVERDVLSVKLLTQPANGRLVDNGNGTLTYTPGTGFTGTDSFTYQARDALAGSQAATVTIDVTPAIAGSYTYSMDQPLTIPDNGFIVSTINVTDSFTILDINVELNISHTRDSDLRVVLVSPNGTPIELFNAVGARGNNFIGTVLDDEGTNLIGNGMAPFTGVYRPTGDLGSLEGLDVQGTWTLEIYDLKKRDTGTLDSWSITVTRGNSLTAAGEPEPAAALQENLTEAQLATMVEEATRRWADSGLLDAAQLSTLEAINFEIASLAGSTLGLATTDTVYIDSNAAGFGWFVDLTPADDEEFVDLDGDGLYTAMLDSAAEDRMDLLTVLLHEIGHILGMEHGDTDDGSLMDENLSSGIRFGYLSEESGVNTVGAGGCESLYAETREQAPRLLQAANDHGYRANRAIAGCASNYYIWVNWYALHLHERASQ